MAKKTKVEAEQLELIDVQPENSKQIINCARAYKAAQTERIAALNDEKKQKEKLLALIEKAHLQRLEDGKIKFKLDGFIITVTPRDELIQVKDENEQEE